MIPEPILKAVRARSSRLPGFYKLDAESRREAVALWAGLTDGEAAALEAGLDTERADRLVENVAGTYALPFGVATNFQIDERDVLVPMVVEEPSVIAAASHGALMARRGGGFVTRCDPPVMIGQIHLVNIPGGDLDAAAARIRAACPEILALADAQSRSLPRLGGGSKGLEVRRLPHTRLGPVLVVHLLYDTRDAMGANAVNSACEAVAPLIEGVTGGEARMRILSNLADRRMARAECRVPVEALERPGLPGELVARRIVEATDLADADPYRATTHNKGVMNGIDPVVIATGNDWRAVEAGAHAHAARGGSYRSLTSWRLDGDGWLAGAIEVPLALGTVGGTSQSHPTARTALKILDVPSAQALAGVAASVGLAQNLSALRALVSEGIQEGHMALHARQSALGRSASARPAPRAEPVERASAAEADLTVPATIEAAGGPGGS